MIRHPHLTRRWRVGRSVGRTIYAISEGIGPEYDWLIGMMDTPELAEEAVRAHNLVLAAETQPTSGPSANWLEPPGPQNRRSEGVSDAKLFSRRTTRDAP